MYYNNTTASVLPHELDEAGQDSIGSASFVGKHSRSTRRKIEACRRHYRPTPS